MMKQALALVGAVGIAFGALQAAQAEDKPLKIMESVPGLTFPFFVHMMNQMKAEAEKLGDIDRDRERRPGVVAQADRRHRGGDHPRASTASSSARTRSTPWRRPCRRPSTPSIPVVTIDRRVDKVPGILAHVGADNVKGGEAQGELIMKLFPNGATIMNLQGQSGASPAIDRNKGLHNVLDKAADKYKIVFEQTAGFDRAKGLSVTEVGARRHGRRRRM